MATYISLREIAEQRLGVTYGALRQYMNLHRDLDWPEVRAWDKNRRLWTLRDIPEFKRILKQQGIL